MCLLLACVEVVRDHPLVCLAVRDEAYDRPSEPPAPRGGEPAVVCGLDLVAGGTWLGTNAAGVVAIVTNRPGPTDPARPSRGVMARHALDHRDAEGAAEGAAAWARRHAPNPFSLFLADGSSARVVRHDGRGPETVAVPRGLHTLTNLLDLDELPAPRVLAAAEGGPAELRAGIALEEALPVLSRVARSHVPLNGPRSAVCVHGQGRGTVSAAIVALGGDGRPARFLFAGGPPCRSPFRDVPLA